MDLFSIFIGKFIFASLVVTFRHGREEDEVMGVSFKKELVVDRVQVFPNNKEENPSKIQVKHLQTFFHIFQLQFFVNLSLKHNLPQCSYLFCLFLKWKLFQSRLIQKLGEGAKPFTLTFPQSAPNSVLIRGEEGDTSSMGVSYEVKLHIGESGDDHVGTKKASVHMGIRKVINIV